MDESKKQLNILVPVVIGAVLCFVGWTWYSFFYTPSESVESSNTPVGANSFEKKFNTTVPKPIISDLEDTRAGEVDAALEREDSIKRMEMTKQENISRKKGQKLNLVLGPIDKKDKIVSPHTDLSGAEVKGSKSFEIVDNLKRPLNERQTKKQAPANMVEKAITRSVQEKKHSEEKENQEEEAIEPVRRKIGFSSPENRSKVVTVGGSFIPIQVVVQDDVAIAQGTSIFMRTTEKVTLGNCTFPQNTLVKGVASVNQNILFIDVAVISYQGCTVSKKLTAHSVDGNRGLVIQGGTENQIRNEAVNDVLNTAQQVVSSPLLRNLPFRASKRAVNNQEVNISKGHTLILMEQ